nr:sushi, von Willebrand factor type A, EGF and pentraxin domain-containing protein 1-like isoform X2 [Crassostrea virginica]
MNPVFQVSLWLFVASITCSIDALHWKSNDHLKENAADHFRKHLSRPIHDKNNWHNLEPKLEKKSEEHQYTQNPNLDAMLQNSQNSQSEGLQYMGMGATIGSAFGPVGTAVGAVVGVILCLVVCHDDPPPPNQPPSFTSCPKNGQIVYAEEGKATAKFEWATPTAQDPEDGQIEVILNSPHPSGYEFPRGDHMVIYTATDSNRLMASCFFSFTVEVPSCEPPQWPDNGYVHCDKSEMIAGTTCNVRCFPGFKMNPQTPTIKCLNKNNKASMDHETPFCEEITCPVNVTEMKPQHGMPICTHQSHKYDTACSTQCEKGYSLDSMMFSVCEDTGRWSKKLPDCKDSNPPEIIDCPNTIYKYTDRNSRTAIVWWKKPIATDNSNNVTLHQTKGPANGTLFRVGFTEIQYQATDSAGNKSPFCTFFVAVEELRCNPPITTDIYMTYQCPNGFTYGSKCNLRCMGRFPLVGNETFVCEKNSTSDPPSTYWDKGGFEPFCKRIPCKDLPAPINGAMSCDTWMFGRQCQMQCSDKFDIPAVGSSFNGVFTCSEKEGVFKPLNTVPNCTEKRLPGHVETLGEFFYYTGSCSDETVLDKIKSNFIKQMEILEKSGFAGVCSDSLECNVGNVSVTCGPSTRKKRSADGLPIRSVRSGSEIRVEIKIASAWQNSNISTTDSLNTAKQIQQRMFDKIIDISKEGKLTVDGIVPSPESFVLGYSASVCAAGLFLRQDTLTCVPCNSGSFLTTNTRGRPDCTPCPKGFYKEDKDELQCTQCPENTSTIETGSTFLAECIGICEPGEFSSTGLSPCTPCEKGMFQNKPMSQQCIQCPNGLTTPFSGSTDANNCTQFDLTFKRDGDKIEIRKSSKLNSVSGITVMSWIKSTTDDKDMTIFHSKGLSLKLQRNISIEKANGRNWVSSAVFIPNGTWVHVAVVIKSIHPAVVIYINGKQKFISQSPLSITLTELSTVLDEMSLSLNADINSGISISGYQIVSEALTDAQIIQSSKTCNAKFAGSFVTMEDFKNVDFGKIEVVIPSQCDSVNDCDNDPCNGHQCIDKVKGYICQCNNGYHGNNCEIKPDFCKHEPCQNGASCVNTNDGNYTCSCTEGFKGSRCEKKIVNGGWSSWSQFSECSTSCNGGTKSRSRMCNSPVPDPEGIPCDMSNAKEHVACNDEKCPECPRLKRSFGSVQKCGHTDDGHTICNVTCRVGYTFLPGHNPLPEYKCGKNTSYEWTGEPPSCGRFNVPNEITTETVVSYDKGLSCQEASQASKILRTNLESSLPCARNSTCTVSVEAKECLSAHRKRRTTTAHSQHVTLTSKNNEKFDIGKIAETQQASEVAKRFIIGLSELELSVQQLNSSNTVLTIEINGHTFTPTELSTTSMVNCPSGQGRITFLCADCPYGTHSSSGKCIQCSKGTYQDESGQTACKQCPVGRTTKYFGSQTQLDCTETSDNRNNPSREIHDENRTLIIGVTTVCVILAMGLVISLGIFSYKKCVR